MGPIGLDPREWEGFGNQPRGPQRPGAQPYQPRPGVVGVDPREWEGFPPQPRGFPERPGNQPVQPPPNTVGIDPREYQGFNQPPRGFPERPPGPGLPQRPGEIGGPAPEVIGLDPREWNGGFQGNRMPPQEVPQPYVSPFPNQNPGDYGGQGAGNNYATLYAEYQKALSQGQGQQFLQMHPQFAQNLQQAGGVVENPPPPAQPYGSAQGPTQPPRQQDPAAGARTTGTGARGAAPEFVSQARQASQQALSATGIGQSADPAQLSGSQNVAETPLALPVSPEFEAARRALEDQMAAELAGIGVQRDQIPAMVEMITQRLMTNQVEDLGNVDEEAAARGRYNSGWRQKVRKDTTAGYDRQRQDAALDAASQYGNLATQEQEIKSSFAKQLAELLAELARNSEFTGPGTTGEDDKSPDKPKDKTKPPPRKKPRKKVNKKAKAA